LLLDSWPQLKMQLETDGENNKHGGITDEILGNLNQTRSEKVTGMEKVARLMIRAGGQ
jgi:hypothetical protein